jgi:hypothetical protein
MLWLCMWRRVPPKPAAQDGRTEEANGAAAVPEQNGAPEKVAAGAEERL